jgi:hypothetical protein
MRLRLFCMFFLLATTIAYSQSVADAAREARAKKEQAAKSDSASSAEKPTSAPSKPKVITNEDLGSGGHSDPAAKADSQSAPDKAAQKKKSAEEWKQNISQQKSVVASMQKDCDELEKSVRFVTANGYSNGPQHNAAQQKKLDRLEVMKVRLQQEKDKLAALRDGARKDGYGSVVYD